MVQMATFSFMIGGNRRYWLFQVFGWGTVFLMNLFFAWSYDRLRTFDDRMMFFARFGILFILGIVFTHVMRMVILEINLLQKKLEKQIYGFTLLTIVFSTLSALLYIGALYRYNYLSAKEIEAIKESGFLLTLLSSTVNIFIFYVIWSLIYFMYHYIAKSRKQQLETLQLETLVKELELKTIKAHINPHFIFNSLNSIRALVDENPQKARKAITELSNILRSSINVDKSETVPLEKELAIVKDYLALENMRFEDRLRVEYQIDEDTLDQPVPPMMLQTLVENAVKHGISKQIEGGVIRVTSEFDSKGGHQLVVLNTGHFEGKITPAKDPLDPLSQGFGLSSTNDRLHFLYGTKGKFEIKQVADNLVEARISIPASQLAI